MDSLLHAIEHQDKISAATAIAFEACDLRIRTALAESVKVPLFTTVYHCLPLFTTVPVTVCSQSCESGADRAVRNQTRQTRQITTLPFRQTLVEIEVEAATKRLHDLNQIASQMSQISAATDAEAFLAGAKKPELTHLQSMALSVLHNPEARLAHSSNPRGGGGNSGQFSPNVSDDRGDPKDGQGQGRDLLRSKSSGSMTPALSNAAMRSRSASLDYPGTSGGGGVSVERKSGSGAAVVATGTTSQIGVMGGGGASSTRVNVNRSIVHPVGEPSARKGNCGGKFWFGEGGRSAGDGTVRSAGETGQLSQGTRECALRGSGQVGAQHLRTGCHSIMNNEGQSSRKFGDSSHKVIVRITSA